MFFRSPLPSLGLLKTVTHVLAILSPMSWPRFVTYVLATDPPERPESLTKVIKRVAAPDPGVGIADTLRLAGLGRTNRFIYDPFSRSYRGVIHTGRSRFLRRRFFYF